MSLFIDKVDNAAAVLDASVLINLIAMDCGAKVLQSFVTCGVVPEVRAEVRRCPITRQPLGDKWGKQPLSILKQWDLDEEDYELYLELHVDGRLHKGEAASLAFASKRNHTLLCDDLAVPRVMARQGISIRVLTTLDVLKLCAERSIIHTSAVREGIAAGLQYCKMATPECHADWLRELDISPAVCRRLPPEPLAKKKSVRRGRRPIQGQA